MEKELKKTKGMLSVYVTTDSGGGTLPTSTKLKIKMTVTNQIHDSEWPFSPVTAIMQQQARRAESPPTQHVGMDISNSHWKGQPEKKFFF